MKDNWTLTGKIVSGTKKGAYYTQLDWVQNQCMDKLGFKPYPGTLNLELSEEYFPVIEVIYQEKGVELISPDTDFCSGKALPVKIEGISGAIIIPAEKFRVHPKNIIEVMSDLNLKSALKLADGDYITIIKNF
jgi:CTP-dependent riboflavin kinase